MTKGILGRKVGMTQIYDEQGNAVPVTVIEAGPCHVLQIRTVDRCLLYTSPSPRDLSTSRMPSSA